MEVRTSTNIVVGLRTSLVAKIKTNRLHETNFGKYKLMCKERRQIPTYKLHTNHKRSSVRSHTLAPTSICDLSHSLCWRPLTDLGHINSVTYVCHPLRFVCGHRKGILTSPLM